MKHFLFEVLDGDYEGEEFIVGADTRQEANDRAKEFFEGEKLKYWGEMTETEAEMSGLDEY